MINLDRMRSYEYFLQELPQGGKILDAGCGLGLDSLQFMSRGYDVVAMSGTIEMCQLAGTFLGDNVEHIELDEVDFAHVFDGIWAFATFIHVPFTTTKVILSKLIKGLRRKGVLYTAFKYGEFCGVDRGRYQQYMQEKLVYELFSKLDVGLVKLWITGDPRTELEEGLWLNILVRKI